jgi:hypothetical protein
MTPDTLTPEQTAALLRQILGSMRAQASNAEPGAGEEVLTIEEAAALARVGVECMRGLVDTGQVYAVRLNQKHCVLLREDVIDFIRQRARQQAKQRRDSTAPASTRTARGGRRRKPLPRLADEG